MMEAVRNGAWVKSGGGGGFVPVEWIESTGLQAIDTDVVFDQDVGIEAELCFVENYGHYDTAYGVQYSDFSRYNSRVERSEKSGRSIFIHRPLTPQAAI